MNVLILDLDETLIYSTYCKLPNSTNNEYIIIDGVYIYKRPYLDEFLDNLSKLYRIGIWTASPKAYALPIINQLIKIPLELIFTGEKCTRIDHPVLDAGFTSQRLCFKRIKKIKKKMKVKIENILIVDNTQNTFAKNYGNGILIPDFLGHTSDTALIYLEKFLIKISTCQNILKISKHHINLLPSDTFTFN